jgi:hypothetical protein
MENKGGFKGFGMGMMKEMMQGMGGMAPMMEKCMQMGEQMAGAVTESASMASFATPEVRGLFEEWARAVEEEILGLLKDKGTIEPSEIAAKLKISEESVLFFIGKMAREKKIKITGIKL